LSDDFGFSPRTADIITLAASLYLFLGSLTALWVLRRPAEAARFLKACCPTYGDHVKFSIQNLGHQTDCPHCKTIMALRDPGATMKMSCVLCGGHVEFPSHAIGQKISWPHCKKTIALPNPEALKTADDAQSGFTLIELLVVIAIIAILAALLLPVLSKAKDQGRQAVCRSNLHQIAIGFQLYGQESNDEFPAPGSKTEYGPQPEDWIWWEQGCRREPECHRPAHGRLQSESFHLSFRFAGAIAARTWKITGRPLSLQLFIDQP
jgi:prepilin-type N-terminal cleavage/methylation domain-containing protein